MRYFGTDGLRGRVGDDLINPSFFAHLGWAIGRSLPIYTGHRRHKVIVGKDTRVSGYMLESALQSGLTAAGVDVLLLGPIPTPGVAHLTHSLKASLGLMVSASHNPYYDNGIKVFDAAGHKISDAQIKTIEEHLNTSPYPVVESIQLGKVSRINEANGRYIEYCRQTSTDKLDLSGIKLVVDCAHGATYKVAPPVFRDLGAEIKCIHTEPNGININEGCGSTHPQAVRREVLDWKADLGISFDGDGDRLLMIDGRGRILNGDRLLYIIATDMLSREGDCSGVVGTIVSNIGLEYALRERKIPFARSLVGDAKVWELMQEKNWALGGEPSGHIICLDRGSTGDGLVASLRVLEAMTAHNRDLGDWAYEMEYFEQENRNIRVKSSPVTTLQKIEKNKAFQNLQSEAKKKLKPSRIILRPSGTEPLIRLMVEGRGNDEVSTWADKLASAIEDAV